MKRGIWLGIVGLALVALVVLVAVSGNKTPTFSGRRALTHARQLMRLGPRIPGSQASVEAQGYIADQLRREGWEVETQRFAYGGVALANVIAKRGEGPIVIVGTHYDTRPMADRDPVDRTAPVPGANDGTSGTAVLLELARVLDPAATEGMQVWLAFFDAEDSGDVANWEWAVGSRYMAQRLVNEPGNRPEYVIIIDMIGIADQKIHYEWSSSLWLQEKLWALAAELGYEDMFVPLYKYHVIADHTPFLQTGLEAALLINMDDPNWHTQRDTLDKLSAQSLQRVGRLLQVWLEEEPLATRAVSR
jgi:Zn-dependent M28 family amino/carboxypeptidase